MADYTQYGDTISVAPIGPTPYAAIAGLSLSRSVVVWQDASNAIRGQIFDHFGAALGSSFLVRSLPSGAGEIDVEALSGGGFLVTWESGGARTFNAAGTATSAAFTLSGYQPFATPDGGFLTFLEPEVAADNYDVLIQRYSASGQPIGAPMPLASGAGNQFYAGAAALSDGGYVLGWTDNSSLYTQRYTAAGAAIGGAHLTLSGTAGGIIGSSGSGFVVQYSNTTWVGSGYYGYNYLLSFSADGVQQGGAVEAATFYSNGSGGSSSSFDVLPDGNGGYDLWIAQSSNPGILFTYGEQEYTASNTPGPSGVTFTDPSTNFPAEQPRLLSVTRLSDGRAAILWTPYIEATQSFGGLKMSLLDDRTAVSYFGSATHDVTVGVDSGAYANNIISTFAGNDMLFGLGGDDFLAAGAGNDTAVGGDGVDVLLGDDGADSLYGGAGQDYLYGGAGDDLLYGDTGVDVFLAGAGDDVMFGGDDQDYFYGEDGADAANGEAGNDIFVMGAGNDVGNGGEGRDYFYMGDGNDVMNGGAGVDVMLGEAGNDTFNGGLGVDYLFLGPQGAGDNDTVLVDKNTSGVSVVYNFEAGGTNDVIRLSGTGWTTFSQVQAAITDFTVSGNFCVLTLDADTNIWLIGVQPSQLTSADFVLV